MPDDAVNTSQDVPAHLAETAADARAAGFSALTAAQLDGLACVHCGRESRAAEPLKGFFGGRQLFECEEGDPDGCRPGCDGARRISAEDLGWEMDGDD